MTEPTPIVLSSSDAGNRGAGEILRRAREAHNLTLEGLASTIKVTPAKLDALERGQYDRLPDANFTRALAMTVCRALKMDPTQVLASLPAAKPTALAEGKPPLNQPFKEVRGGSPLFDRSSLDWRALLSLKWGAPILLLIGAVVIYALPDSVDVPGWLHRMTQPAPQQAADVSAADPSASAAMGLPPNASATEMVPAASAPDAALSGASSAGGQLVLDASDGAASSAAPAAILDPRLTPPGSVSPAPAAQLAPQAAASSPVVASAESPGSPSTAAGASSAGSVMLAARESSWIEVRDAKGAKLLSRHVRAGEEIALDGTAPFSLRIGNAPGVQLSYKGQAVDLGPMTRNNVARVELK